MLSAPPPRSQRVNSHEADQMETVAVTPSKPVEDFYKNVFEPNRVHLEARSQHTERNASENGSLHFAFGIKEGT